MNFSAPVLAAETSAARLLDMPLAEFRELVAAGHLPKGRAIAPGVVRWPVDDLRRLASGEASEGLGGTDWAP